MAQTLTGRKDGFHQNETVKNKGSFSREQIVKYFAELKNFLHLLQMKDTLTARKESNAWVLKVPSIRMKDNSTILTRD